MDSCYVRKERLCSSRDSHQLMSEMTLGISTMSLTILMIVMKMYQRQPGPHPGDAALVSRSQLVRWLAPVCLQGMRVLAPHRQVQAPLVVAVRLVASHVVAVQVGYSCC